MDALERLIAQQACTDVVTRYAVAVNAWDLDAFVALFTPDAVWQRPRFRELRGHAAIREFMGSLPTPSQRVLRHVNGGVLVELIDDLTASVWSQTTVYESGAVEELPAPLVVDLVVEYRDRMVKVDGQWLIDRRDTTQVFKAGA